MSAFKDTSEKEEKEKKTCSDRAYRSTEVLLLIFFFFFLIAFFPTFPCYLCSFMSKSNELNVDGGKRWEVQRKKDCTPV